MYIAHSYRITVDRVYLATVYNKILAKTTSDNLKANGHKVAIKVNSFQKGVK